MAIEWSKVYRLCDEIGLRYAVDGLPDVKPGVSTVLPSMRRAAVEYGIQRGEYGGKTNENV